MGWFERGVKNRPKRRGVTEGSRRSLRRDDLVGDRSGFDGDDEGN